MNMDCECDLLIVGGGLAGGLIALALTQHRPELRVTLVEAGASAGGNHIWSFFDSDVDVRARALLEPLVAHRWANGHRVRFPGYDRDMATPYNSITSARFDRVLRETLGERLLTSSVVAEVSAQGATLNDGRVMTAGAVIDARGFFHNSLELKNGLSCLLPCDRTVLSPTGGRNVPDPAAGAAGSSFGRDAHMSALRCGWQKFVGQTLLLRQPHGLDRPVIMDATGDQIDGYRFVYVLPTGEREIFIEDTYYSDGPALDVPALQNRIAEYAAGRGWAVESVVHEETGVLPVVYGGDFDAFWPVADPVARAGVRAGLFQPMTGYSLAEAARFALALAQLPDPAGAGLAAWTRTYAARRWREGAFYRTLGVMLFKAAVPDQRVRIFSRFYRLSEPLIGRFYAGRSKRADMLRILCGRPPVPIRAAMRALLNRQD